jgi:phosphatidylserine/phosphatidylglycerophosphate/cardiolipin synthase-like enzyme
MRVDLEFLEGEELYQRVVLEIILGAQRTVWIATANVKDCHVELEGEFRSITEAFLGLCRRGVEVRLLHSGIPSAAFRESLKARGLVLHPNFRMRRCPRVHFKAVLVDDRWLHLGSANLTGAGLGAKAGTRRNFELGLLTSDALLLERVAQFFYQIWEGRLCPDCGRAAVCPVPLEEPV